MLKEERKEKLQNIGSKEGRWKEERDNDRK